MVNLSEKERAFMRNKYFASFAIASPKTGNVYNTTVWAHYDEETEKFYVITNKETAKWRFLDKGNQRVGINIVSPNGWPYLSVNGKVNIYFQDDRDDFWRIVMDMIRKYNSGDAIDRWRKKMEDAGNRMLLELEPENMFSTV